MAVGVAALVLLGSASVAQAATGRPVHPAAGRSTGSPADDTDVSAPAFTPCSLPSQDAMNAWLSASPYRAVSFTLGSGLSPSRRPADAGCTAPTPPVGWVTAQRAAGWQFIPLYPGPQAAQILDPMDQGHSAALTAIDDARTYGITTRNVLYADMIDDWQPRSADTDKVLTFLASWTTTLHDYGYLSGLYAKTGAGLTDLVQADQSRIMPDVLDFAEPNGDPGTDSTSVPTTDWAKQQRVHEYADNVNETYSGYPLQINKSAADVQTAAPDLQLAIGGEGAVYSRGTTDPSRWLRESDPSASRVATSGGVQMILDGTGTVWAKESVGTYGWTRESDPGARAVATAGGLQLIIGGDGDVWAKNSIGLYGWTRESDAATAIAVSAGGRQVIIGGDGHVYQKKGFGLYGWAAQNLAARAVAISDETGEAELAIGADGRAYITRFGGTAWRAESDPGVRAVAIGDHTQVIIGGDGDVWAKYSIGLYGWTRESDTAAAISVNTFGTQLVLGSDHVVYAKNGVGLYGWTAEGLAGARGVAN